MLRNKKQIAAERRRVRKMRGMNGEHFTAAEARHHIAWHRASGHRRGWRVVWGISPLHELNDRRGRLIIFRSSEAAQKRADKLNEQERKQ